jgi:heterodisulfide reductase subunit A
VVLSVGMQPPKDARKMAETFALKLNSFGFCDASTFHPIDSGRDGVYVAGPFTEPKDIPETVAQASGAAAKVLGLLSDVRGTLVKQTEYPPETDIAGQEPRVGVFVCHCGTNIAGVVNVPDVVDYARRIPGVVYAENNLYTCSNDTQERIKEKIREHNLNRIVVASCTPRTHEPLFRNTIREAGLNPFLFEMANIRDQCSWVHMHEPEEATEKSRDLVRIAVAKVKLNEPLYPHPLEVNRSALVVGGGLAGLTAALALAEEGFGVALIEREGELGGYVRRLHYLFDHEDPRAALHDLIARVQAHRNITVYASASLQEVKGSLGNFTSTVNIGGNGTVAEIKHGVVIVATGADVLKPTEYLYGQDPRVLVHDELEQQLAADRFDGKVVAFIQCVGSRTEERPYCSRTCCTETIKHALRLKERRPETQVYVLYRELRAYGFREAYYTRARKLGVTFIRFPDDKPPTIMGHNGKLSVFVHAAALNESVELRVDNVVLAPATIPRESNKELAQLLKVPLSEDQFFLEAHRKLRPVDFATDGIFLCGNAHSPLSIDETISQALATAARAATILSKERIDLEPTISHVVEENCDGCAYCVEPCPFKAITLVEYEVNGETKKRVVVNESLCKGCGTCMATCPKKAIFVWHFKPEMLSSEVRAALGLEGVPT